MIKLSLTINLNGDLNKKSSCSELAEIEISVGTYSKKHMHTLLP